MLKNNLIFASDLPKTYIVYLLIVHIKKNPARLLFQSKCSAETVGLGSWLDLTQFGFISVSNPTVLG